LVEENVDFEFPKDIEVKGATGERVVVGVEYPWLPIKCKKCKSFGHLNYSCTKIEKQVWVPRRHEPIQKELPTQKVSVTNKANRAGNVNLGSVVRINGMWSKVLREIQFLNLLFVIARSIGPILFICWLELMVGLNQCL
jgi:hypothetical protein